MKQLHFKLVWIFAGILFLFTACQKENPILEEDQLSILSPDDSNQPYPSVPNNSEIDRLLAEHGDLIAQYPSEVTVENWETFTYAPPVVIQYHTLLENAGQTKTYKSPLSNSAAMPPPCTGGLVLAYDEDGFPNSWRPIQNVTVVQGNCSQQTTQNLFCNYDLIDYCAGNPVCMSYETHPLNGVSALDLVRIQQHLIDTAVFDRVQQYLAADADRNVSIEVADRMEIKRFLLGFYNEWSEINPATLNVLFIPEGAYQNAQDQLDLAIINNQDLSPVVIGFLYEEADGGYAYDPGCKDYNTFTADRRVIKKGDVNGTWTF